MGRKIPGKKHRGVKDPEKQSLLRLHSIKHKINAPPSNPDDQVVPKSLQYLIKLKEKFKANPKRKRKHNHKSELISTDRNLRKNNKVYKSRDSAPAFNQKVGESTVAFMRRVNTTVQEVIRETKFEDKYKVKVHRNLKTGEVANVTKQKADPLKPLIKEAKENEKAKKKKKNVEPKLTKSQKKKKKLDEKKAQKELQKAYDFNIHTDEVKFGEVVHAPPTLVTPKKVNKTNCASRPGTKDLLLKSVFNQNKSNETIPAKKTVFQKIQDAGKVNKKGKRKDLPHAIRRQLETQRTEIVNAYRSLKAKKNNL